MFNKQRADDVKNYLELLKHTGDFTGQPFVLLPWQQEFIDGVYGEIDDITGYRTIRYGYLEIAKKNGKTELIAGIATYHLNCSQFEEIYCCAADKQQASLIYKAAKSMLLQDDYFYEQWESGVIKISDSKKQIVNRETNSVLTVLSAEAYTKHGLNPTLVIFDELHAQPNRDLWDVMTFGAGSARKEPLWLVITTAGDDPDRESIGYEQHEYAEKIIAGEIQDKTWFAKIYAASEEDDPFAEETWIKANPSLGHTISLETIKEEAESAKNNPNKLKLFKWLRLNIWTTTKHVGWLDVSLFDENVDKKFDKNKLDAKMCYIGTDLSSTGDLTAKVLVFPKQDAIDKITVVFAGYIPEDNMRERERLDRVPFSQWTTQNFITATEGEVVDYNYIKSDIRKDFIKYKVIKVGGDPWNAEKLRQDLYLKSDLTEAESLKYPSVEMIAIPQNLAMFTPTMKEVERLIRTKQIRFIWNPAARWCFGNLKIFSDGNENMKPVKINKRKRIDLMVAMFNAFYLMSKENTTTENIYKKRGIITI